VSLRRAGLPLSCLAAFLACASSTRAATILFNFDTDPAPETTPFTDTVGGLSATFSGEASVCATGTVLTSLTGNVLIQDFCAAGQSGPLSITFSSELSSISFNFATAGSAAEVTLSAFENTAFVGSSNFTGILDADSDGEGVASFTGIFNTVQLSNTAGVVMAIDNVSATAVPEPANFALTFGALALLVLVPLQRKLSQS
jgi:hypothetical protein